MATTLPYYEQKDIENIKKLREMMTTLPPFCTEFFSWDRTKNFYQDSVLPMHTISLYFSISLKKEIPYFPKWREWILL